MNSEFRMWNSQMKAIHTAPALAEQVYQMILDDICSGEIKPGTHLVQEQLAESLGVSRQPVQQALALLRADGLIEEAGKRGVQVARLDLDTMHHHYQIRSLLDGLAARGAASRIAADADIARQFEAEAGMILAAGRKAVVDADIPEMIRQDEALHRLFYEVSGNPLLAATAEPHWRYLRRVMGDVLRKAEPPHDIWRQHEEIVEAALAGDADRAERLMTEHATRADDLLTQSARTESSTDD
jgi:DNA-binding GntR family transcriptional regulator